MTEVRTAANCTVLTCKATINIEVSRDDYHEAAEEAEEHFLRRGWAHGQFGDFCPAHADLAHLARRKLAHVRGLVNLMRGLQPPTCAESPATDEELAVLGLSRDDYEKLT